MQSFSLRIEAPATAFVFDKKHLRKVLRSAGTEIAQVARSMLRGASGSGRMYRGGGGGANRGGYKKGAYRASAPGQLPVNVTGTLARSIKVSPSRSGDSVSIRDAVFYAKMLEVGAKGGGRSFSTAAGHSILTGQGRTYAGGKKAVGTVRVLQPRPFLTLALAQRQDSLRERITTAVQQDIAFVRIKP